MLVKALQSSKDIKGLQNYRRGVADLEERYQWLYLKHVKGWTYAEIEREWEDKGLNSTNIVARNVPELAELIGISLQ